MANRALVGLQSAIGVVMADGCHVSHDSSSDGLYLPNLDSLQCNQFPSPDK